MPVSFVFGLIYERKRYTLSVVQSNASTDRAEPSAGWGGGLWTTKDDYELKADNNLFQKDVLIISNDTFC